MHSDDRTSEGLRGLSRRSEIDMMRQSNARDRTDSCSYVPCLLHQGLEELGNS